MTGDASHWRLILSLTVVVVSLSAGDVIDWISSPIDQVTDIVTIKTRTIMKIIGLRSTKTSTTILKLKEVENQMK